MSGPSAKWELEQLRAELSHHREALSTLRATALGPEVVERVREALTHAVYRTHQQKGSCSACKSVAAALALLPPSGPQAPSEAPPKRDDAEAALASVQARMDRLEEALTALDPQCITSPPCGSCVGCDALAALDWHGEDCLLRTRPDKGECDCRSPAGPDALDAALEAEREACARVAEGGRFLHDDAPDARFGKACAAAIRARGTK